MTTYKGLDGFLSLGGILTGTPVLAVSYVTHISEIAITGGGSTLTGVVAVGDTFTISGESGSPTHTITGSFYDCTGNAPATLAFTVSIAATVSEDATVTFDSNSVGEVRTYAFTCEVDITEDTAMGDKWATHKTGLARWSGSGEMMLDYDDAAQAELIDSLATATPSVSHNAILFGSADEKTWYAQCALNNFAITQNMGDIVMVTFNFTGSGSMRPRWD